MNQIISPDPFRIERQELCSVRADLLAVKAIIANRRLALIQDVSFDKRRNPFEFAVAASEGRMLLVGEGNFTFSLAIVRRAPRSACNIHATAFEKLADVSYETLETSRELTKAGANVGFDIDGTKLDQKFPSRYFQRIVFQFPNAGSRASAEGSTANHRLISDFFCAAGRVIAVGGQVIITIVDNNYYHGVFDLKRAADGAGFKLDNAHPFYRSHYEAYQHSNTKPTVSALQSYRVCTSYVFTRALK
jgi:hypothetical protein